MKKFIISVLAVCAAMGLASCGNLTKPDPTTITKKNDDLSDPLADGNDESKDEITSDEEDLNDSISVLVNKKMEEMTIEEKVGQLFMIRPDALELGFTDTIINDDKMGGVTYVDKSMERALQEYPVGGVVMFEKNIVEPDRTKAFAKELQSFSAIPMFIGIEEEGGEYSPLANNMYFDVKIFEDLTEMGDEDNAETAKDMGKTISSYLVSYGFNINMAPYANIVDNDDGRKFSRNADVTSEYVGAEIEGFHANNMMAVLKYFPAESNSGNVSLGWNRLLDNELVPFTENIKSADMIMVGHVLTPGVTSDGMPASMSEEMITGKLRNELGFKGVVITKSMADKSVTNKFSQGECAINAINAGADIIYTPYSLQESYSAVLEAVKNEEITEERLDKSVKRILRLKAEYGILK